jgi:hypothetical protein
MRLHVSAPNGMRIFVTGKKKKRSVLHAQWRAAQGSQEKKFGRFGRVT